MKRFFLNTISIGLLMIGVRAYGAPKAVAAKLNLKIQSKAQIKADEEKREDGLSAPTAFQQALRHASQPLAVSNSSVVTPEGRVLFPTDAEYSTMQLQGTSRSSAMDRGYRSGPTRITAPTLGFGN